MRKCELKPNAISLSAARTSCEKGGVWRCTLALLDEMRERGLKFDVINLSAAMSACENGEGLEMRAWAA